VANYQANQPDLVAGTLVTRLINAGDVSSRGIEIDTVARITSDLTISGDYAYVDAKIDRFKCPVGAAVSCDVNGKPLPFAPKHKLSVRAQYEAYNSERLRVGVNGNYTYQTEQQNSISQTPDTIAPGYGILNGTIAVAHKPSGWEARLLVRNILNEFYRSSYAQSNGGIAAGLPRDYKRYFGFSLRKDF
jgi:iron complex outermembrane receptor protein